MLLHTFPECEKSEFNCPHCLVFAQQGWHNITYRQMPPAGTGTSTENMAHEFSALPIYRYASCLSCNQISIWEDEKMIYPLFGVSPLPNADMPPETKKIFEEARKISSISPRASAGLLRLCVEKLTEEIEEEGDLNTKIANLVKKGLPIETQQALDIVRVTGNDALHVGQIDLNDCPKTTRALFSIVNIIVQRIISDKKQIADLYEQLPKEKRDGIVNRDKANRDCA